MNTNIELKEGRMRKTAEFTVRSFWQLFKCNLKFPGHSSKKQG